MTTIADSKEYTPSKPKTAVTIKGQAGKQIKIEAVSLTHAAGKAGVSELTTVSINGTPYAAWKTTVATYSALLTYNKYPYLVDEGKDAVISWKLATGNSKYPGKMKNVSCTYSYVAVETETETPAETEKGTIIIVEGLTASNASTALENITKKLEESDTDYESIYIANGV